MADFWHLSHDSLTVVNPLGENLCFNGNLAVARHHFHLWTVHASRTTLQLRARVPKHLIRPMGMPMAASGLNKPNYFQTHTGVCSRQTFRPRLLPQPLPLSLLPRQRPSCPQPRLLVGCALPAMLTVMLVHTGSRRCLIDKRSQKPGYGINRLPGSRQWLF